MESGSNAVLRRFRLVEELEYSEKKGSAYISFGLDNAEDRSLTKWNASIFGPDGTKFENRFYSLIIDCGPDYPSQPPKIKFQDKVNLPFVGPTGELIFSKLGTTKTWNSAIRIHNILEAIRNEMTTKENRGLPQPADGRKTLKKERNINFSLNNRPLDMLTSVWK